MKTLKNEPVMVTVLAFVAATVALLVAFGVHVTADQREAIEGWVGAAITLAVFVRSRVRPVHRPAPEAPALPPAVPPVVGEEKAPAATTIADAPVRL